MPINQKGVFNPWLVLVFGGVLLGGLVLSGKFNSWLNLSYQPPKNTPQPVVTTQPEASTRPQTSSPSSSITPKITKEQVGLNGLWEGYGYQFNGRHSGNSLILISTTNSRETVKGTISGNRFTGSLYLEAKGCPNLDKTVPVNGTISDETLTLNFSSVTFKKETCTANGPETLENGTVEYTKISED